MKMISLRGLCLAGALSALISSIQAQVVEFRAIINAAQETPATNSTATGSAIMLYDVAANTFDLFVTLNNFSNTITASHVHEAASGVAGPIVTNLGAEAVYTRSGNTIMGVFKGVVHGGSKLALLQTGAYLNFHTATFPAGEIRGQLVAQPKRLTAVIDVAQEKAAFPAATFTSNAFGAAVMTYSPATNKVNLRVSLYNFANTLTASHYHEGAPGVSGPVVTNLGAGTVSNYVREGNWITGTFLDLTYAGDVIKLLTGEAYVNFHSNVVPAGEIRGQVIPSEELLTSRFGNLSSRGFVGTGDQVLIGGLNVTGREPVRALITAKGPSLAGFGVPGVLANPRLALFDSAGRLIAQNDDIGAVIQAEFSVFPGIPTAAAESALVVVLPPGNYTAIVSGVNNTTGTSLLETTDLRNASSITVGGASENPVLASRAPANGAPGALKNKSALPAPELCIAVPLAIVSR